MNKKLNFCRECGKEIDKNCRNFRYCSDECIKKHKYEYILKFTKSKLHRNKQVEVKCEFCGKLFKKPVCRIKKVNYCSSEHYFKDIKRLRIEGYIKSSTEIKIKIDDKKLLELYNKNYNDEEMAILFNISKGTVRNKRISMGLQSKYRNLEKIRGWLLTPLNRLNMMKYVRKNSKKHEESKFALGFVLSIAIDIFFGLFLGYNEYMKNLTGGITATNLWISGLKGTFI